MAEPQQPENCSVAQVLERETLIKEIDNLSNIVVGYMGSQAIDPNTFIK